MSVPSWVRVGAKCVYIGCPEYRLPQAKGFAVNELPAVGLVYTIRDVQERDTGLCLRLLEMCCSGRWPDGRPYTDAWLHTRAFRPLVDNANDAEIEAQIYRKKVSQKLAPIKDLERVE